LWQVLLLFILPIQLCIKTIGGFSYAEVVHALTLVGKDRSGIVSHVTNALYEGGCNLGEALMMRLGGNFTIMLMVNYEVDHLDGLLFLDRLVSRRNDLFARKVY